MAQEDFQLGAAAARAYEEQKVAAIFGPLAEATLDRLAPRDDEAVLDIACGTGIVARVARRRLGPAARIAAADLNEHMLEAARAAAGPDAGIDFRAAPAEAMPFGDGAFSLAICQQGLQFFPDEAAALTEARRLLAAGGRLAISVWAGPSPLFAALAEAISAHVGDAEGARSLAPFSYRGHTTLPDRLTAAGFSSVSREEVTVDRKIPRPEAALPKEIMGNPVGAAVAAKGDAAMRAICAEVIAAMSGYRRGDALIVPQTAALYIATV